MELSVKHFHDSTVQRMVSSHRKSVDHPEHELVHLYEIRDALARKFKHKKTAITSLHLSEADWSRLGGLCNTEPLEQGRHRGEYIDSLRDATADELNEARTIAKRMILAYLKYIDLDPDDSEA